jgi:hypothetical protein
LPKDEKAILFLFAIGTRYFIYFLFGQLFIQLTNIYEEPTLCQEICSGPVFNIDVQGEGNREATVQSLYTVLEVTFPVQQSNLLLYIFRNLLFSAPAGCLPSI